MEQNILSRIVLVNLGISLWTGRKKLDAEDIKVDASQLPPEKLASLGTKKIIDPESLRIFFNLKRRAETACSEVGVRFLGAYAVPEEKVNALMGELEEIKAEFTSEKAKFLAIYNSAIEQWIQENSKWEQAIRRSVEPSSTAAERLRFATQAFKVQAVSGIEQGLNEQASGLADQLIFEIGQHARQTWEVSYKGRIKVTRKALRPLVSMLEKLRGLEFLSPHITNLADQVQDVLKGLPKTGPIEGKDLASLIGVLHILGDLPEHEIAVSVEADEVETGESEDLPFFEESKEQPTIWF